MGDAAAQPNAAASQAALGAGSEPPSQRGVGRGERPGLSPAPARGAAPPARAASPPGSRLPGAPRPGGGSTPGGGRAAGPRDPLRRPRQGGNLPARTGGWAQGRTAPEPRLAPPSVPCLGRLRAHAAGARRLRAARRSRPRPHRQQPRTPSSPDRSASGEQAGEGDTLRDPPFLPPTRDRPWPRTDAGQLLLRPRPAGEASPAPRSGARPGKRPRPGETRPDGALRDPSQAPWSGRRRGGGAGTSKPSPRGCHALRTPVHACSARPAFQPHARSAPTRAPPIPCFPFPRASHPTRAPSTLFRTSTRTSRPSAVHAHARSPHACSSGLCERGDAPRSCPSEGRTAGLAGPQRGRRKTPPGFPGPGPRAPGASSARRFRGQPGGTRPPPRTSPPAQTLPGRAGSRRASYSGPRHNGDTNPISLLFFVHATSHDGAGLGLRVPCTRGDGLMPLPGQGRPPHTR